MSYQSNHRFCLLCAEPIEGRSDKQFCSSACKARYNREQQSPALPATTFARTTAPVPIAYPIEPANAYATSEEEDEEDWSVSYERERKLKFTQEKAEKLHRLYKVTATRFLRQESRKLTFNELNELVDEVDEAATHYQEHPGLYRPDHPAHSRLRDLYLMRDYLRELNEDLEEAEESTFSFFGGRESANACLMLSKKHRKRLRENMIGEA